MDSALVWFRRDLRLHDQAALFHALKSARRVWCAFVFDRAILDPLLAAGRSCDRRVEFIHGSVAALHAALQEHGGGLIVRHGNAADEIERLAADLAVDAVFANHDDEPYAIERDARVAARLALAGRRLLSFKDHVIFERDEVRTGTGGAFSVFTAYKNAWLRQLTAFHLKPYPVQRYLSALAPPPAGGALPGLAALGFASSNLVDLKITPGEAGASAAFQAFQARIDTYAQTRDFPAVKGPSYLSVHLRFGTVSPRALAGFALARWQQAAPPAADGAPGSPSRGGAEVWLAELIWRDFYHQILFHHPHVVTHAFKPAYDRIAWADDPALFAAWCAGRTGYPLVDAAMAQINQTGYMHNRLRMVVASFLVKDLGIDWRWGERCFALHLNDFDLAANNGGWQWAASSGCDAQPYFRIFNPVTQSEKFDPDGSFIKRYLPQLANFSATQIHAPWRALPAQQQAAGCLIGTDYPGPIVDHAKARATTLARYAVVKM